MKRVTYKNFKALKITHVCDLCKNIINIGEPAFYYSTEDGTGPIYSAYHHIDCHEAQYWLNHHKKKLNKSHDFTFLRDINLDDEKWLFDNHPHVAKKLMESLVDERRQVNLTAEKLFKQVLDLHLARPVEHGEKHDL